MTRREREAAERRTRLKERAIAAGDVFFVAWRIEHLGDYDPCYHRTLADAQAQRDKVVEGRSDKLPNDYFERQCRADWLDVWIYQYIDGEWRNLPDEARKVLWKITYAD